MLPSPPLCTQAACPLNLASLAMRRAALTDRAPCPSALAGTYFWHGHTGADRGDGLAGPMVVHPRKGEKLPVNVTYDGEHTIFLSDWWHTSGCRPRASGCRLAGTVRDMSCVGQTARFDGLRPRQPAAWLLLRTARAAHPPTALLPVSVQPRPPWPCP